MYSYLASTRKAGSFSAPVEIKGCKIGDIGHPIRDWLYGGERRE